MRQLLLLRHAKTERTNPGGDHARRLMEGGREDAMRMGQFLAREILAPDHALVSDATRAMETFEYLGQGIGLRPATEIVPELYLAQPSSILEIIHNAPESADRLLVIGHNPGLHQLAFDFGQRGPRKLIAALAAGFPTCCLVVINCETASWRDVHPATCRLDRYMTAKALREIHSVPDGLLTEAQDDC